MIDLAKILGPAATDALDPQYAIAVARRRGSIHWLLSDHDNFILDWRKWRDDFVKAGYDVPSLSDAATVRSGIVTVDETNADDFLAAPEVRHLTAAYLRKHLIGRFSEARSWWDVAFLFPIAFLDFDNKKLAAFYAAGAKIERYVPDGWVGEFSDFADTYPEAVFPSADKFWIVDGKDLLAELNRRGSAHEEE
ncbi:hypothetical protein [Paraburkholderia strydomiana]|uniref:Group-specific protein n=1 Tax=Paraburkholderia strydomiana TaxID=1245417 RepID=A0ABW9BWC0_9BURK